MGNLRCGRCPYHLEWLRFQDYQSVNERTVKSLHRKSFAKPFWMFESVLAGLYDSMKPEMFPSSCPKPQKSQCETQPFPILNKQIFRKD